MESEIALAVNTDCFLLQIDGQEAPDLLQGPHTPEETERTVIPVTNPAHAAETLITCPA